jgi:hypothetical protein
MTKTASKGERYALLFPGGGYFYVGHWIVGFFDAVFSIALIVLLASRIAELVAGIPGSLQRCLTLAVLLIAEKIVTTLHAGRLIRKLNPEDVPEPELPPRRARIEPTIGM